MIIAVSSVSDPASRRMGEYLVENYGLDRIDISTFRKANLTLKIIDASHLYSDTEEIIRSAKTSGPPEGIVFLSKHSSSAKIRSMTVHPVGNFSEALLGGLEGRLSRAFPDRMTDTLRNLKARNTVKEMEVTFEATHHGPFTQTPAFYLEIGTTEEEWNNKAILDCVLSSLVEAKGNTYPNYVGIGGGHYAPKFTQYVFSEKANIGHIVPKYQRDHVNDQTIRQAAQMTPNCRGFIMDFKGCNSEMRNAARTVAADIGLELIEI